MSFWHTLSAVVALDTMGDGVHPPATVLLGTVTVPPVAMGGGVPPHIPVPMGGVIPLLMGGGVPSLVTVPMGSTAPLSL
jgi:hypothetical protein